MRFISTRTKLTGPHTPSSETDEWYKLNTMFRAVVYQTGTAVSRRPELPSGMSATSSVCLLRDYVGPAGVFF